MNEIPIELEAWCALHGGEPVLIEFESNHGPRSRWSVISHGQRLCVHERITSTRDHGWTCSHIQTGLRFFSFETIVIACQFMEEIEPLDNWKFASEDEWDRRPVLEGLILYIAMEFRCID